MLWISQFEEAVKQLVNPYSERAHWKLCMRLLPLSLDSEAYSIWQNAENRRSDWVKLRIELEEAFEDTEVRMLWKSDMKAYIWDEIQPLQHYRANVEQYVDTFDKDLCNNSSAKKSLYYTRFLNGLPEDYSDHVTLSLSTDCMDIADALEACLRFQNFKLRRYSKPKIGASARLENSSVTTRIAKNEARILKLEEELERAAKIICAGSSTATAGL